MPIGPGTRLGPYEIQAAIGAGGMGEVYRATDTALGRQVAIKVLPENVASNPDRLARFEREAKTLAVLNHPNIAQIYGLERTGGTPAIVMELVEGETLADRIARGPIPMDEALPIAKQIAEALEAAHEQGIIHRDLKPANIKVRPDGTVKALDFGLAKLAESSGGARTSDVSLSPTITSPAMTAVGVLLGTAAYMSPEQAKGRLADKRSDIWAFGCVLYEMLTGKRPFDGEDVTDVMVAVLSREPDWNSLPAKTPAPIRRLLRRCLEKDRKRRLESAGDARLEIEDALTVPAAELSHASVTRGPASSRRVRLAWAMAGLLLGGVIAVVTNWSLRPVLPRAVTRAAVPLPEGERLPTVQTPAVALAPDGSRLAYISESSAGRRIYLRPLESSEAKPVPGTEGADGLSFSPDGTWLAFTGHET